MVAHKVGVDPDTNSPCAIHKTSHEYFKENFVVGVCESEKEMRSAKQPVERFDLIFIDGSHFHEVLLIQELSLFMIATRQQRKWQPI